MTLELLIGGTVSALLLIGASTLGCAVILRTLGTRPVPLRDQVAQLAAKIAALEAQGAELLGSLKRADARERKAESRARQRAEDVPSDADSAAAAPSWEQRRDAMLADAALPAHVRARLGMTNGS